MDEAFWQLCELFLNVIWKLLIDLKYLLFREEIKITGSNLALRNLNLFPELNWPIGPTFQDERFKKPFRPISLQLSANFFDIFSPTFGYPREDCFKNMYILRGRNARECHSELVGKNALPYRTVAM